METVEHELESTPTPPPILFEQLSPLSTEGETITTEPVQVPLSDSLLSVDNYYMDAEASRLRSFTYVDSDRVTDVLGMKYLYGERDHALKETIACIQQELTEAMLRIKRYEIMIHEQRIELEKHRKTIVQQCSISTSAQIEQLQQHYAHKLRLKAQEVQALSKRVNLLKTSIQAKMDSQLDAAERINQIEAMTLRASETRVHHAHEYIGSLRGQLLDYQRAFGILHLPNDNNDADADDDYVKIMKMNTQRLSTDITRDTNSNHNNYHGMDSYEDRSGLDNLASVAESLMYSDQHIPSEITASQSSQPDSIITNYSVTDHHTHNREQSSHSNDLMTTDNGNHISIDNTNTNNGDGNDDFSTESEDGLPEPGTKRKQLVSSRSSSYPMMSESRHGTHPPVYLRNTPLSQEMSSDMLASTRESLSRPLVRPFTNSGSNAQLTTPTTSLQGSKSKATSARMPRSKTVEVPPRPRVLHVRWTQVEDELLRQAVEEFGELGGSWTLIASRVPGRSSSQCRHRWFRIRTSEAQRNAKAGRPRISSTSTRSGRIPRRTTSLTLDVETLGASNNNNKHLDSSSDKVRLSDHTDDELMDMSSSQPLPEIERQ
ncbi:hypothetical protein BDF22DRAFT_742852 [Syncephalis plumigaleata]|nr:hypothetical protein BDF22DRAFT_742852 [Syncephalis plumigaleata]